MTLGNRMRVLRGKRTQQEIADRLGISRARYSHYETDRVMLDNELLQEIADIYAVSTDYLLGRDSSLAEGISAADADLIEDIRRLSDEDREYVVALIKRLRAH